MHYIHPTYSVDTEKLATIDTTAQKVETSMAIIDL